MISIKTMEYMYMCNKSLDLHKAETVQFYIHILFIKILNDYSYQNQKKDIFFWPKTIISTKEKHFIECS